MMPILILFTGGLTLALPNDMRVLLLGSVYLDNAALMIYLVGVLVSGRLFRVVVPGPAFRFAVMVSILAGLVFVSAWLNGYLDVDAGKAARMWLLATQMLVVAYWTRRWGTTFVLRWYLVGMAAGGVVNIYHSVTNPYMFIGILPVLYSRNAAGGFLAIAALLSAWLMLTRERRPDLPIAVGAGTVALVASAMSYSRTAMLIGACGLVAWSVVLSVLVGSRHSRRLGVAALVLLVAGGLWVRSLPGSEDFWQSLLQSVAYKFEDNTIDQPGSTAARFMYYPAVGEILLDSPLLGVSIAGFATAVSKTSSYKSGLMEAEEEFERGTANPHNSFLYYISACGIPGLLVVLALFIMASRSFRRSLRAHGRPGVLVAYCLVFGYFVYGMTLPSLFNTPVLYVPVGVAMTLASRRFTTSPVISPRASLHHAPSAS